MNVNGLCAGIIDRGRAGRPRISRRIAIAAIFGEPAAGQSRCLCGEIREGIGSRFRPIAELLEARAAEETDRFGWRDCCGNIIRRNRYRLI